MAQELTIKNNVSGHTQKIDKEVWDKQTPRFRRLFSIVTPEVKPTQQVKEAAAAKTAEEKKQ